MQSPILHSLPRWSPRHCQKTLPDFTREFLSNLPAYPTHYRMMSVNPHVRFLCSVSSKPSWPQASPALPTCPTWHLSLWTPSLPLPSVTFRLRQVKLWRPPISSEIKSAWISEYYELRVEDMSDGEKPWWISCLWCPTGLSSPHTWHPNHRVGQDPPLLGL